jgi:hypothetical protein
MIIVLEVLNVVLAKDGKIIWTVGEKLKLQYSLSKGRKGHLRENKTNKSSVKL